MLVTLAVLCLPSAAAAAKPAAPTSADQPTSDGCQRNANGVVFLKTPEWVYVYRNPTLRSASGIVRVSHLARDDAPGEHRSHDYNANLVPGAADRYLLGGDPAAKTGNFSGEGEELGRLHFEWESGVVPDFAWPTDGDRATLWGSWIWDCGHWTGDGGAITGEHTEFHPLTAMAISRRAPFEPRTTQSQRTSSSPATALARRRRARRISTLSSISATNTAPLPRLRPSATRGPTSSTTLRSRSPGNTASPRPPRPARHAGHGSPIGSSSGSPTALAPSASGRPPAASPSP